jgi:ribosomal protein L37E
VSLRQLVRGLFADGFGDDVTIHYECRHCGAALDSADDECDACGSTDVSRYAI